MNTKFMIQKTLLLVIFISFNYSCVSNAEGKLIRKDIAEVNAKYKVLENRVNDDQNNFKRKLRSVDVKLLEMDKILTAAKKLLYRNNADFGQEVVSMDVRLKKTEGKSEEILFKFEQLEKKFKELQDNISDVNGSIAINNSSNNNKNDDVKNNNKKDDKASKDSKVDNKDKNTIAKSADYQKINNPIALFKLGYSYINGKKYKNLSHKERMAMAIKIFEHQVNKYPNHKKSNSARYWITQAYYSSGQYEKAYRSLNNFLEKYPKSRHLPQVLFQMGNSLKNLGLNKDSKIVFKTLIKVYPKSGYSKQAKVILKKL